MIPIPSKNRIKFVSSFTAIISCVFVVAAHILIIISNMKVNLVNLTIDLIAFSYLTSQLGSLIANYKKDNAND